MRTHATTIQDEKVWPKLQKEFPNVSLPELQQLAYSVSPRMSGQGARIQKRYHELKGTPGYLKGDVLVIKTKDNRTGLVTYLRNGRDIGPGAEGAAGPLDWLRKQYPRAKVVVESKAAVIAALLQAKRPDLANAVAHMVVAKDAPPLKSKTGMRLREDLGGLPQFADFTDDAWVHFGNHVKKYGDTRIVFTGALQALLAHAFRKGKALPMTVDYGVRWVPRDSFAMKTQYQDRYLGWLEDAGIVEKTTMSAKDALKVQHTKRDEAAAKENPQQQVEVYVAGDTLPGIIALMQKYGAKMSAQGMVTSGACVARKDR